MRAPDFWNGDTWPSRLLIPASWIYRAGTLIHRALALARPTRVSVPVICVGNLVAGGAGKTPVALSIGRRLKERGKRICFLTRGYGGRLAGPVLVDPLAHDATAVGDEALLLARVAPTIVARDRAAGARCAAKLAEMIVMDDGFQNPHLVKDLSFVTVDGAYGFGNRRLLPAGPLREPLAGGLARADAIVHLDHGDDMPLSDTPLLTARIVPGGGAQELRGRAVVAFAGIGRPEKFFATLEKIGCTLAARRAFADHHVYSAADIAALKEEAARHRALLVTTEKDRVRLPDAFRDTVTALAISVAWDDPEALDRLLDDCLAHG